LAHIPVPRSLVSIKYGCYGRLSAPRQAFIVTSARNRASFRLAARKWAVALVNDFLATVAAD
jgi:hypothetical protein